MRMDAIERRTRPGAGLTLIELVVVMAILSLMAAISIPVFIRYGRLNNNELQQTAGNLQEMIRAAQLYATTYNNDSALVYTLAVRNDSVTGNPIHYISGFAVARRLKRPEIEALDAQGASLNTSGEYYVPVQDREGRFRKMSDEICMTLMSSVGPNPLNVYDLLNDQGDIAKRDMGLVPIHLVDTDGVTITPPLSDATNSNSYIGFPPGTLNFPAHKFYSSGFMQTDSSKQRFTLYVTALPDAPEDTRYVEQKDGSLIPRSMQLELYATLGRVKVIS